MWRLWLSEECWLQPLEESDASELHELIDVNRAYLGRWMGWAQAQSLDDTLGFIRATRQQLADNDGFQAAILSGGEIIGVVGFHGVDWSARATSLGYWLDEQHQGHGTITRAVGALVDHAFHAWRLDRVEIRVALENHRSRAIPGRLGFREEGVIRNAERIGERCLDSVVYVVLARDWPATRALSPAG
jgi:ribosomal-protein-serine acetyltransferase